MPSRDPKIRAIEVEAARLANADGNTSHAERYRLRQQLRSQQGLGKEGIKRGGISGVWDRNKGAIGSIAGGLAASFIPGAGAFLLPSLGGMLGGAAARGRLDADNLIGDGLGGMGGGGIRNLASSFIPKAAGLPGMTAPGAATNNVLAQAGRGAASLPPLTPTIPTIGSAATSSLPSLAAPAAATNNALAGMGRIGAAAMPAAAPTIPSVASAAAPSGVGGFMRGVGGYIKENPEVAGLAIKGVTDSMNNNANRAMQDRRLDLDERMYEDEQQRRRRIAELLAPMWNARQNAAPPPMPGLPALPTMGGR